MIGGPWCVDTLNSDLAGLQLQVARANEEECVSNLDPFPAFWKAND